MLDLFSGIGGFSLGLERAGMKTVAFCEADPIARRVLAKNWPTVPCFNDVRKLCRFIGDCEVDDQGEAWCPLCEEDFADCACVGYQEFLDEIGPVDLICGGFPCQDISLNGRGAGITGERSGLWFEFARIIGVLNPAWVIVENVAALRSRGLAAVIQDLWALGYVGRWDVISAAAVGAEHKRERVWIIANTTGVGIQGLWAEGIEKPQSLVEPFLPLRNCDGQWEIEPDVRRANDGFPGRSHRLKQLGNAVVPQIPELLGREILRVSQ